MEDAFIQEERDFITTFEKLQLMEQGAERGAGGQQETQEGENELYFKNGFGKDMDDLKKYLGDEDYYKNPFHCSLNVQKLQALKEDPNNPFAKNWGKSLQRWTLEPPTYEETSAKHKRDKLRDECDLLAREAAHTLADHPDKESANFVIRRLVRTVSGKLWVPNHLSELYLVSFCLLYLNSAFSALFQFFVDFFI